MMNPSEAPDGGGLSTRHYHDSTSHSTTTTNNSSYGGHCGIGSYLPTTASKTTIGDTVSVSSNTTRTSLTSDGIMKMTNGGDPLPPRSSSLYYENEPQQLQRRNGFSMGGTTRSKVCSMTTFCYCVQVVNCALVCALIALAVQEYPKIEALEAQVETDKTEIANLEEEVRNKQEGQIEKLHQEVQDEQQFNFLTLAGTFTLLTCLISMFHMSSHLQKMNQPNIQRKIIAILWMSPIYSVTSFLTLWFPSIEGAMAITRDFYEAYCIYTFLSFLIAVLGQGDRDRAVDVLARHASHLERPTRCLSCFYDPPPDVSDLAKANAVVTQCQIYCLQFTFIRPITTVIYVLLNRGSRRKSDDSASGQNGTAASSFDNNGDGVSSATGEGWSTEDSETSNFGSGHNGTRWLEKDGSKSNHTQTGTSDGTESGGSDSIGSGGGDDSGVPLETWIPTPAPLDQVLGTLAPSVVSGVVATMAPTMAALAPTIAGAVNSTIPTDSEPSEEDALVKSTEAYFKSPGFALAMVVNISVFFAFSGLLMFYHAVRDDLQWIRPWPKFLSIKAVVFLTFWQGLMILIFVVVLADPSEKEEATAQAHRYQNMLICMEMLLFSIWQWCVFPAEEWEPNYQPKEMHTPGLGIKDFAQEVGTIMQNGTKKRRKGRRRISKRKSSGLAPQTDYAGVYQRPGNVAEQYDDEDFTDGEDAIDDGTGYEMSPQKRAVQFGNLPPAHSAGLNNGGVFKASIDECFTSGESGHSGGRDRALSDGTGNKADDEFDSDMDML